LSGNGEVSLYSRFWMTLISVTEDAVQWYRAEADMERWQEQYLRKHADFHRSIKYCHTFSEIWRSLAKEQDLSKASEAQGMGAYARRAGAIWDELERRTRAAFTKVGAPEFVYIPPGKKLHEQVRVWQESEIEEHFSPFYR
jgi:hypothetical protein